MDTAPEMVEVPVRFLHELLDIRREHYIVCDLFKIPVEKRGESFVGKGIVERISTYITAYVVRKSTVERETQAAFVEHLGALIQDPVLDK